MQFGAKPLFENVSVKFNNGNRYGLIGANGCGKSTFMKILGGDLEPSAGQVMLDSNTRLGKLRQDQFAFEDVREQMEKEVSEGDSSRVYNEQVGRVVDEINKNPMSLEPAAAQLELMLFDAGMAKPDTALWSVIVAWSWQQTGLSMVIYLAGLTATANLGMSFIDKQDHRGCRAVYFVDDIFQPVFKLAFHTGTGLQQC